MKGGGGYKLNASGIAPAIQLGVHIIELYSTNNTQLPVACALIA